MSHMANICLISNEKTLIQIKHSVKTNLRNLCRKTQKAKLKHRDAEICLFSIKLIH